MVPPQDQSDSALQGLNQFLEFSLELSQAAGGGIWHRAGANTQIVAQKGLGDQRLDQLQETWSGHQEKILQVFETGEPSSLSAEFETAGNSQSLRLLLIPLHHQDKVAFVLEIFLPPRDSASEKDVVKRIGELWTLFAQQTQTINQDFAAWLIQIHQHLSVDATCLALANETRSLIGWDRVSVSARDGWSYRVKAISGLEAFDRRSGAVREIEKFLRNVQRIKEPISLDDATPDEHLAAYTERVSATQAAVIPLQNETGRNVGFLIAEVFEGESPAKRFTTQQLRALGPHAATALNHALDYDRAKSNILVRTARAVFSFTLLRLFVFVLVVAGAYYGLTRIPADLVITGVGSLHPEIQRDVFSTVDGIVQTIHVVHGQSVDVGEPLITLRSPELEFRVNELEGKRNTIDQQIRDLDTLRTDPRRASKQTQSAAELAARAEELKLERISLDQQIIILKKQIDELVLRSPIAGEVTTWNLQETLSDRPLRRTDRLLTISDLKGPWVLKILVDQRDTGPVVEAVNSQSAAVTYVTADRPEVVEQATVREFAPTIEVDAIHGAVLEVVCDVPKDQIQQIRPGTTVMPRIDCGEAPCGYVWFRRFIDRATAWWNLW